MNFLRIPIKSLKPALVGGYSLLPPEKNRFSRFHRVTGLWSDYNRTIARLLSGYNRSVVVV